MNTLYFNFKNAANNVSCELDEALYIEEVTRVDRSGVAHSFIALVNRTNAPTSPVFSFVRELIDTGKLLNLDDLQEIIIEDEGNQMVLNAEDIEYITILRNRTRLSIDINLLQMDNYDSLLEATEN